jgi:hypothetical protein
MRQSRESIAIWIRRLLQSKVRTKNLAFLTEPKNDKLDTAIGTAKILRSLQTFADSP